MSQNQLFVKRKNQNFQSPVVNEAALIYPHSVGTAPIEMHQATIQIPYSSDVTISIYDAKGRIVRHLDIVHRQAGAYRTQDRAAHWDGQNEIGEVAASGVYFILLKASNYQQARRIVLIR
jgi:flagellar hook assembly protein FlgD